MKHLLRRLAPFLHLTRVTSAIGAVGAAWFVVLWTRSVPAERAFAAQTLTNSSLALELIGSGVCAVGLYAFATALNDVLDRRRDAALHPRRPLPSGRVSLATALILLALTLGVAVLGALALGPSALAMTLGTAAAIGAYNAGARFVPSAGLVLYSLIYGAMMMTPNVHLVFVWPVVLVMAHALAVGAIAHRVGERRPVLSFRAKAAAVAGWMFWSGVLVTVGTFRGGLLPAWVSPTVFIAPGVLALAFLFCAEYLAKRPAPAETRAAGVHRLGALWLPLYGAAWMLGHDLPLQAATLAGVTAIGLIGMTVLRDVFDLIEHPVGYLR